jgi:acyl transferase domain-containing protein
VREETSAASTELFVLSAQTESVLREYLGRVRDFMRRHAEGDTLIFGDLIATFQLQREPMPKRIAVLATNPAELVARIERYLKSEDATGVFTTGASSAWNVDPAVVQGRLAQKDWEFVARAWVTGHSIPWEPRVFSRRPFPEYPCNREREFWIQPAESPRVELTQRAPGGDAQ